MSMKIIIENPSSRVYTADYGIPTIQLGDGGTIILDIIGNDAFHGIGFIDEDNNDHVGKSHTERFASKPVDEIGMYLQILTDNPASLDILIDKCQRAKQALIDSKIE